MITTTCRHVRSRRAALAGLSISLLALAGPSVCWGHNALIPPSLKEIKLPPVPNLTDGVGPIVVDTEKAIALGKALFWDMNVGSDGMACASCHFHAGVDSRTKNQVAPSKTANPGNFDVPNAYDPKDPRGANLSNYQITKRDFPLAKFGPDGKLIEAEFTTNVVASAGTFSGQFTGVAATGSPHGSSSTGAAKDACRPYSSAGVGLDQTFHVGGTHTRRIEPRNTPTVINAALFDRQFWDGRADATFNGVSGDGARDPGAYVWVVDGDAVWKTRLALINSSLASQAVGPPINEFEMSCKGRTWPDIGRKLLQRRPLEAQEVHPEDSVLGKLRHSSGKGLNQTYEQLIQQAFAPRYWSAGVHPQFGAPAYDSKNGFRQAEVNFSLFFGVALQLYEQTLISDDTPFDRADVVFSGAEFQDRNGVLTEQQLIGLREFNDAHCLACHTGPLFSLATNRTIYYKDGHVEKRSMVQRLSSMDGSFRLIDTGFMNNGAVPSAADPGVGNKDAAGRPLAFAPQYLASLAGRGEQVFQPLPLVRACDIGFNNIGYFTAAEFGGKVLPDADASDCPSPEFAVIPNPEVAAAALDRGPAETHLGPTGSQFKVPQMYNIELTGPYMHNGGFADLGQVLDQYLVQQGNFRPGNSPNHVNPEMHRGLIIGAAVDRDAMLAFLSALTDERVRYERAPFDHPQLLVPNGHPGDQNGTEAQAGDSGLAKDEVMVVPAIGRNGRSEPIEHFYDLLPD